MPTSSAAIPSAEDIFRHQARQIPRASVIRIVSQISFPQNADRPSSILREVLYFRPPFSISALYFSEGHQKPIFGYVRQGERRAMTDYASQTPLAQKKFPPDLFLILQQDPEVLLRWASELGMVRLEQRRLYADAFRLTLPPTLQNGDEPAELSTFRLTLTDSSDPADQSGISALAFPCLIRLLSGSHLSSTLPAGCRSNPMNQQVRSSSLPTESRKGETPLVEYFFATSGEFYWNSTISLRKRGDSPFLVLSGVKKADAPELWPQLWPQLWIDKKSMRPLFYQAASDAVQYHFSSLRLFGPFSFPTEIEAKRGDELLFSEKIDEIGWEIPYPAEEFQWHQALADQKGGNPPDHPVAHFIAQFR